MCDCVTHEFKLFFSSYPQIYLHTHTTHTLFHSVSVSIYPRTICLFNTTSLNFLALIFQLCDFFYCMYTCLFMCLCLSIRLCLSVCLYFSVRLCFSVCLCFSICLCLSVKLDILVYYPFDRGTKNKGMCSIPTKNFFFLLIL